MKETLKKIVTLFQDSNGKLSSKRVSALVTLLLIIAFVIGALNGAELDNTILITLVSYLAALQGVQGFTRT